MQPLGGLGLPELLERPGFELADSLSAQAEGLSDLLEGVLFFPGEAVAQAEAGISRRS